MAISPISSIRPVDMSAVMQTQAARPGKPADKAAPTQNAVNTAAAPSGDANKPSLTKSSAPSPTKVYQAADANKDNQISYQEERLYALMNPVDENETMPEAAPAAQMKSALDSYKQALQKNSTPVSSLITQI